MAGITYFANPCKAALPHFTSRRDMGVIVTPKQGNRIPEGATWCADNGWGPGKHGIGAGFPGVQRFLDWLEKLSDRKADCMFAVAPDVVGDARATLERSLPVMPKIRELGYLVAFVFQDGLESMTEDIPWDLFDVAFIGGSTEWKMSAATAELVAMAKGHGKLVHFGRVNSRKRLRYAESIGCDSADGTYLTFGPEANLPRLLSWLDQLAASPALPTPALA